MFALIFNGKVVQIEPQTFPVAPALEWVDITGLTPPPEVGWSYDGVAFTPPPPPPPPQPKSAAPLTAEELAEIFISKGSIGQGDIDAKKAAR